MGIPEDLYCDVAAGVPRSFAAFIALPMGGRRGDSLDGWIAGLACRFAKSHPLVERYPAEHEAVAQDFRQQALEALFRAASSFDPGGRAMPYVRTVAKYAMIKWLEYDGRRGGAEVAGVELVPVEKSWRGTKHGGWWGPSRVENVPAQGHGDKVVARVDLREVCDAISRLPQAHREWAEVLAHEPTAAELGRRFSVSQRTAERRKAQALEALRQLLASNDPAHPGDQETATVAENGRRAA